MPTAIAYIPAVMDEGIFLTTNHEFGGQPPAHTRTTDGSTVSLYRDNESGSTRENHRATMIAQVLEEREGFKLLGDFFIVADEDMLRLLIQDDKIFQATMPMRTAFNAWLNDYCDANGLEYADGFQIVCTHLAGVMDRAQASAARDVLVQMGLDPNKVMAVWL